MYVKVYSLFDSSVQFSLFNSIKSKRPTGHRISHSAIYIQILMRKDLVHKVTINNPSW